MIGQRFILTVQRVMLRTKRQKSEDAVVLPAEELYIDIVMVVPREACNSYMDIKMPLLLHNSL